MLTAAEALPTRAPARLVRLAAIIVFAALLALALLVTLQRRLIYPAPAGGPVAVAGFTAIDYATTDGLRLRALYRGAASGRPTVVFFHGNGDSLRGAALATAPFTVAGYSVLLAEYRGYGGNPGRPTEPGLYADGRAALAWLAARGVAANEIVLIGNSIGSGPAVQLATERDYRALIIVSGFSSLQDVVTEKFRMAWLGGLVLDRFANAAKLPRIETPVLILHGDADRTVPVTHAQRLALADPTATLRLFPGVGHGLAYRPEAAMAMLDWLGAQVRPVRHRPPSRAPLINRA